MNIDIFFDYTCRHSFALHRIVSSNPPADVEIKWRTYPLKELRRPSEAPSVITEPEASFSVLALTLAHGVDEANFPEFHRSVFEKVQASEHKLTNDDLFGLAEVAGVSREAFASNRSMLIARVKQDYEEAYGRWNAHGTPTIVFDGKSSVYFRFDLEDLPGAEGWDLIESIAKSPWLLEAKRSQEFS